MSRPDRRAVQRRKHLRKRPPKASRARRGGSAKDLDTLCDNIGNEVFAPRIPPMLWHYTPKWEGLAGILRSRKLWATDYRHQRTDEFEFRHADKAILQLAEELAADDSLSAWHHARVEAWLQRLRTDPWANAAERLFITSFCERGDNADVWREFAAAHSGFAIEFELLCDEEVEGLDFGLIVMQVDYDEAAVTSRLRHLVLKILETSQRYPAENRDAADRVTERQLWFLGRSNTRVRSTPRIASGEGWPPHMCRSSYWTATARGGSRCPCAVAFGFRRSGPCASARLQTQTRKRD